jgi:hypothetical protein
MSTSAAVSVYRFPSQPSIASWHRSLLFFQSSEPSDPLSSSVFQRFFQSNLIGLVKLSKPIVKNC